MTSLFSERTSADPRIPRTVHKYNVLMKDFPLNELLAATDLAKVQESILLIFGHLSKKLKLSWVPPPLSSR
jgi:hypothetical protein